MAVSQLTSSDPLINRTIEGYEFIKRLGEGTYGVVYLARHPRIRERLVAIKYLKLGDPSAAKKVEREVDILARLQHPNVIHIYDAYRFEHYQLIVMELIRGGSLQESLQHLSGLLDLGAVIEGIEQLAFALGYVHEQNILHLDLKPANILLDPIAQGQLARFVLTDFGIAQIVNPGSQLSTNMVGTPMYMSPEHFGFGDNKPDNRSDIYSLGIILYELVVGNVPFQSKQLLELLNQHAYSPVPLPSQIIPYLPPALDNIILKALAKSPEERFQNANELGSALRELRLGPMGDLQSSLPGRVSGEALGAIAQAGAQAMQAIEDEHPIRPATTLFNLLVMKPDGSHESLGFQKSSIIGGRERGVDLHLDQASVSRRHVQIDCDRHGNLFVTDLQSANGTYLDGVRLTPHERVAWRVNQFLQIQGFLLQIDGLASGEVAAGPVIATTDQVVALLDKLQNQRSRPGVQISLTPAVVYLEVGKPQYIQVRVSTENTPLARYELRAKPGPGIDERWFTLPAGQVIQPDDSYVFDFVVSIPGAGTTGGKTHEIMLEVIGDHPDVPSAFQILKVRVVPFTRFSIALRPSEVSHNRRHRADLIVTNNGNQSERFTFEIEAPDTLKVTPRESEVDIPPGQEKTVRLSFRPARDAQRAKSRLVYSITVHSASGKTERANGSYIFRQKARVPRGIILLWALLVVVMAQMLLFGVSIPDQWTQFRTTLEYLFQAIFAR